MDHPRSSTMIFGDTFARDFYQSRPLEVNAVADDAIGGITGKIVAQLSSFYCDLRGQGNSSRLGNGRACSKPIRHLSVQGDSSFGDCCRFLQVADCGDSIRVAALILRFAAHLRRE